MALAWLRGCMRLQLGSLHASEHSLCDRWLQIVRGQLPKGTLPSLAEYMEAAAKRRQEKKTAPVVPTMRNLMATAVQ